ncbi:WD40/YVTN/BNR-like repeat-containing protein [Paenibacillus sp. MAH-36]|uniref:Photosynthesis system II assembly factor YCF48-like protein n=1 Tax=Paenibacillus violae TaxID=3077234 RepID=A0ABU3RL98_9BACL|nr:hypothetical protein [Paenibacillus sp. PFR10]MDU0204871.1 hypothetical protein [Paenibacillus sp. PFR10]
MNKLFVSVLIALIFFAGCANKESGKTPVLSMTSTQPSTAVNPTTTIDKKEQLITSFSSKSQDKQLKIYTNESKTPPLNVKTTDNTSKINNYSNLPIKNDWEKDVKKENIFASINSNSNVKWLLLSSEPAAGQMMKTLYKSGNNGKSWVWVNDVSQVIDGYVTGVTFRDDKNGWISATQHGAAMVPLYRTKDGGESWSNQAINIPKGFKYGNVYPPIFDENDTKQGTLNIEFVSDTDKKTMEFKTTDGGETWKS